MYTLSDELWFYSIIQLEWTNTFANACLSVWNYFSKSKCQVWMLAMTKWIRAKEWKHLSKSSVIALTERQLFWVASPWHLMKWKSINVTCNSNNILSFALKVTLPFLPKLTGPFGRMEQFSLSKGQMNHLVVIERDEELFGEVNLLQNVSLTTHIQGTNGTHQLFHTGSCSVLGVVRWSLKFNRLQVKLNWVERLTYSLTFNFSINFLHREEHSLARVEDVSFKRA